MWAWLVYTFSESICIELLGYSRLEMPPKKTGTGTASTRGGPSSKTAASNTGRQQARQGLQVDMDLASSYCDHLEYYFVLNTFTLLC